MRVSRVLRKCDRGHAESDQTSAFGKSAAVSVLKSGRIESRNVATGAGMAALPVMRAGGVMIMMRSRAGMPFTVACRSPKLGHRIADHRQFQMLVRHGLRLDLRPQHLLAMAA